MYEITYTETFEKKIDKLKDKATIERILKKIKELENNPYLGEKLLHYNEDYRSLRIGDWRVIYQVKSNSIVIITMGHGHDAYEELNRYHRCY